MSKLADEEARRREALHAEAGDYRPPKGDHDGFTANKKGFECEIEFGNKFKLPLRRLYRAGGDDGWDFMMPWWVSETAKNIVFVDTKSAVKPTYLCNEQGKTIPDNIYVLGRYYEKEETVELQGWQYGHMMIANREKRGPKYLKKIDGEWIGGEPQDWWPNDRTIRKIDELIARRLWL